MTHLNLAYFQDKEGKEFSVKTGEDETYELLLTDVKPKAHAVEGWESFTLYFQGSKRGMLPQQTIPMTQGEEELALFMVPIEETKEHFIYESVFNIKLEDS